MRPIIFHADDANGSENTETIVVSLSEMKTGLPTSMGYVDINSVVSE
jgi:hypothetical protein